MRVCSQPGCPELIPQAGRCLAHAREREQARGSKTARGYGRDHYALRNQWKPQVEAGAVLCARCSQPILVGEPWDLGHDDNDRSRYNGPEHARCNRSAAGRQSHR